ncbi:6-hydroxymethylpterin diphosphokinase MptE-like protein [Thomasclavelia cocleata]|uniref:6-hydroxymethylpterin diphosphokinase MptE-like protein n=1 Tax=Thomasclavelia cocleata TaxID=69824 RepID=UPI00272D556C|nr:6-hydroxymethylpterin diphosphokinase MptE-like protein [Thomasclavelia cocleata]
MQLFKSIKARSIRFKARHYYLFKEGRRLKKLKNIHLGKRCFIIGNGPSLKAEDLSKLYKNNEITFAFNRIYHIFDQTKWRPTYYISQDEKMLAGCIEEVENLSALIKFIPAEMKWYYNLDIKDVLPFHIITKENNNLPSFSTDISKSIINSKTVVYTALQIAYYMGIKEIYLIGVDHHFHMSMNSNGEIIIDNSVKDYFSEDYNQDKDNLYIPNTDESTFTYVAAKRFAANHDLKIYNATRGGKLEVFDRVDLDNLF